MAQEPALALLCLRIADKYYDLQQWAEAEEYLTEAITRCEKGGECCCVLRPSSVRR